MRKSLWIALGMILFAFALSIALYHRMPEEMASHWEMDGDADGYSSRVFGMFMLPIISLILFLFFVSVPKIDPLKNNIELFRKHYDGFIAVFIGFLFYIHLLVLAWNIVRHFNIVQMMAPGFGIVFYYIGVLTEKSKRNWFIGIRTPWTLSNDAVWKKTHVFGGKMFKIAGVIAFCGIFFSKYALFFTLIPVIVVALITTLYSYRVYHAQEH